MNPFQGLITECLVGTKHVEHAALLVAKTGNITAQSPKFQVSPEEAQMLADAFKHLEATREQGLCFKERKFRCSRADRTSIYCTCGGRGLILVKTALYVLVATFTESMYPGVCVEAVEKLAEYLREKGK